MKSILTSLSFFALVACGSSQPGSTQSPATGNSDVASSEDSAGEAGSAAALTLKDLDGQEVSLESYRGKTLVLEWFSPACPFSRYAHAEGPLKDMASRVTASGDVAWLAINSNSRGKGADLGFNRESASNWNIQHPVVMDSEATLARQFGAKTTPHMFVLDAEGAVVYKGALDNAPRGDVEGDYVNYVDAALADIGAGNPVATAETKSYGCGVKY